MKWLSNMLGARGCICALAFASILSAANAHLLNMTRVSVVVEADHGMTITVDIDLSLLLGTYDAYRNLLQEPESTRGERLKDIGAAVLGEIGLQVDAQPITAVLTASKLPDTPPEKLGDQTIAALTTFEYRQELPQAASELTIAPASLAKIEFPLAYTFSVPSKNLSLTRWLELPGSTSRVLRLPVMTDLAAKPEPASTPATTLTTALSVSSTTIDPPLSTEALSDKVTDSVPDASEFTPFELKLARVLSTILQHVRLGFRHIFPQGTDHVLFVLGLFFLAPRWRPLLSQTTAFTLAHTTTLGLAAYGIVSLSPRIIEPLIALSIAYIAFENIWRPKLTPARVGIVFGFGLLHGLGFASSLSEVPMPREQFFTALFSFNIGVDVGQLAVIGAAFLAVGWFRHRPWYRKVIVIPSCGLIGAIGAYWTVSRTFF